MAEENVKNQEEVTETAQETEAPASEEEVRAEDTASGEPEKESQEEEAPTEETSRGSFFGRKKKEKDKKDTQIEDLTDKLQRSMAEFDNFRKRTEKEKASMYAIGAREVIEKILPVVDNFERGLASAKEEDPFAEGMKMTYKQLMTALDDLGVKAIEAAGQPFDPNLHNAVMHIDDPELGENVVAEEFQKGYTYKDSVIRFSMVKVAN